MKRHLFALSLISASMMLPSAPSVAAPLDAEQQQQVKEMIRSTLVENPDILVEAMAELRKRELVAQQNAQKQQLTSNYNELFNKPGDPFIGNPKGKVTMVYFSDFNCGFCKRQDPVLEQMVKQFPDLKIIYKDFPVLGESSVEAAELALSAHKMNPGVYHKLHQRLMSKAGPHNSASIAAAAKAEGLNVDKLKKNIDNAIKQRISENRQLATELGVRGTPALVFADEVVGGYTEAGPLSDKIKARLN